MANQAPRSVKFQEDNEEEVSVMNTFVHVPDKEARMAWRQKTSRSAPGSMFNLEDDDSTEVYPAERDERDMPNFCEEEADEDDDDDAFPIAMTHVKTYDSFDGFDLRGVDDDEENDINRAPSVQKVSTFDPFEETGAGQQQPTASAIANSTPPQLSPAPMPCPKQENAMPASAMMCVQAFPVQLVPAVIPAPAAMGQGLLPVPSPSTAPTPSSPSTSPRQPILLGRTGQTVLPQADTKMDVTTSPLQCVVMPNGKELVRWSVDGRKLESQEKQILSPEFELNLGPHGLKPFRVMILAKETKGKGGRGFVKAGGRGRLFIKCETSSLPGDMCQVGFRAVVGHGTPAETSAGPLWHQFTEQPCCPLQGTKDDWDLLPVVDSIQKRFEVLIEVVGHSFR